MKGRGIKLTLRSRSLANLQPSNRNTTGALEKNELVLPTALSHGPHAIDGHPRRHASNGQRAGFLVAHVARGAHESVRGKHAVRSQDTRQGKAHAAGELLLRDLAGLVFGEESREDAVADFPVANLVANLGDHTAHVRAGDCFLLADGFVVGVFAVADCDRQYTIAIETMSGD